MTPHDAAHPEDLNEAGSCGQGLRDDSRPGRARHSPAEAGDKPDIQTRIEDNGQEQNKQGKHGFAESSQNPGEDVVKAVAGRADKQDLEIDPRHLISLRRRVAGAEHRAGQGRGDTGDQDGHNHDEGNGIADGVAEMRVILGPEVLRHHDHDAGADRHENDEEKVLDGAADADGPTAPRLP